MLANLYSFDPDEEIDLQASLIPDPKKQNLARLNSIKK